MTNLKVTQLKSGEVYVSLYLNGKRRRIYSGLRYSIDLSPNEHPKEKRVEVCKLLAYEIEKRLRVSSLESSFSNTSYVSKREHTHAEALKMALKDKLAITSSKHHKNLLLYAYKRLTEEMSEGVLSRESLINILNSYNNKTSYNTIRAYLFNLCNQAIIHGLPETSFKPITRQRQQEVLHKPILDLTLLLEEIKTFNHNLYLCCLLTYGCLLRPHIEIRELTWGDFSHDLSRISISGQRNKSGRNRIVPVPNYIKSKLTLGHPNLNIFSNKEKPYNQDYFKSLWGKFKKQSSILKEGQTLYSFRHTAALDIYKRTGSIDKLRLAMGHSNIRVTLTYLRGLDIPTLMEEDMPQFPVLPAPEPPEPPEL